MTLEALNSRISVLNANIKRINEQRQQNIGRRETLQHQLDDAISSYNAKYGTELTVDTVESEVESVTAVMESKAEKLEKVISLVQGGNYKEAEAQMGIAEEPVVKTAPKVAAGETVKLPSEEGVKVEATKEVTKEAEKDSISDFMKNINIKKEPDVGVKVAVKATEPAGVKEPVNGAVKEPVGVKESAKVAEPVGVPVKPPVERQANTPKVDVVKPKAAPKPVEDDDDRPAPPPTFTRRSTAKPKIQSFDDILGGTPFNPLA